jgi:hypothetical protein
MAFFDDLRSRFGIRKFTSRANLKPGTVLQFTYDGEQKYALVLNPEWEGKMHALSLPAVSEATLEEITKLVGNNKTPDAVYSTFKNSKFVADRPYRTYLLSKIKTLREIYIKSPPVGDADAKPNVRRNTEGKF